MEKHSEKLDIQNKQAESKNLSQEVASYYDSNYNIFNRVFGNTIQVFQPLENEFWLNYLSQTIDIKSNNFVLDAGCGNCIPAIHFAKNISCKIEAVTISERQFEQAKLNIRKAQLEDKINVVKADFHELSGHYSGETFDQIYFLESIGHSNRKAELMKKIFELVKIGGAVYIQDLFYDPGFSERQIQKIKSIQDASHYFVEEISDFLKVCECAGFSITSCENLSVKFFDQLEKRLKMEAGALSIDYSNLSDSYCSYIYGIGLLKTK